MFCVCSEMGSTIQADLPEVSKQNHWFMVYFCVFVRWERLKYSLCVNSTTCTYVVDVKIVYFCLICKATEAKPT